MEETKERVKNMMKVLAGFQKYLASEDSLMISDDCPANRAYQKLEEAVGELADAIGMSFEESEKFIGDLWED